MKVTILGSGPSGGVPGIGHFWGKCDPNNPKNRRLRPSIFIEDDDLSLLVDTSPDLRQQLLNIDIKALDAILYTHGHADHLHGIDDLRSVNRMLKKPIDIYLDRDTLDHIEKRFGYVLEELAAGADFYKPVLTPHLVKSGASFEIKGRTITPVYQNHGYCDTLGFRIGDFAYSTDVVDLPEESLKLYEGVKVWIIGTLVETAHKTHADVEKALEWIDRIKPQRAYLSHLSVMLDYDQLKARLPDHVEPCYDGMEIRL